jgi:hypothetical protein
MKHTAKKVYAGCYSYRGYEIEYLGHDYGPDYDYWLIMDLRDLTEVDATNWLGDAKRMIDNIWENERRDEDPTVYYRDYEQAQEART